MKTLSNVQIYINYYDNHNNLGCFFSISWKIILIEYFIRKYVVLYSNIWKLSYHFDLQCKNGKLKAMPLIKHKFDF